jgi:DNA ligase (NAD+)
MTSIIEKLKYYDNLYYNEGTSPISDDEYDSLKNLAQILHPNNPYFETVGSEVTSDKVKLPYVLGSLNKLKIDTVDTWLNRDEDIFVTDKLDGVSFVVTYENGDVVFAATRGNGNEGKDITEKVKIFCPRIERKDTIVLRGEALLTGTDHEKVGYKTRRNGAAGILNRDDNENAKFIYPIFYELVYSDDMPNTEVERYMMISSIGLKVSQGTLLKYTEENKKEKLLSLIKNSTWYGYDTDGLVLTINNSKRENVLYPKNKVAFKVNEDAVRVKVTGIEWNTSRTGRVVPVILLEPTVIQGVTVSRTTGFNYDFVSENYISENTELDIVRSGDVIPYIVNVYSDSPTHLVPENYECPSCGNKLKVKGVDLICDNFFCVSQSYYRVEYFLRTLGAENITTKTLMRLGINDIEKAYELDEFDIADIEGFGFKKAEIIVNEISRTLKTTPEKFLAACGLPNVGIETWRSVLKAGFTLSDIINDSMTAYTYERECEGIGTKTAKVIENAYKVIKPIYDVVKKHGMVIEEKRGDLRGKQFTLTGKGPMKRDNLIKLIEGEGGIVKGISKNTDYLVTSTINSTSSKMKKADKYGVKVITYDELMEELGVKI